MLVTLGAVLAVVGDPIPVGNEWVYLVPVARVADGNLLSDDWTFSDGFGYAYVFSRLIGAIASLVGVEVAAWCGRLFGWLLALAALFVLGKEMELRLAEVCAGVVVWVWSGQAVVAGEWMLGSLEAKTFAYACVFFALALAIRGRHNLCGALAGLAFTVHPAVGLWAGLATVAAVTTTGASLRQVVRAASLMLLFALPGAVIVGMGMAASAGSGNENVAEFLVTVRLPHHLDPASFAQRDLLCWLLMAAFNVAHIAKYWNNRRLRTAGVFETVVMMAFLWGLVIRLLGVWDWLLYFPFRVGAIVVPMFFFWRLIRLGQGLTVWRRGFSLLVVFTGILAVSWSPNLVGRAWDESKATLRQWKRPTDSMGRAFAWVKENTEGNSRLIAPPSREDVYLRAQRSVVGTWKALRYEGALQWMTRMEDLLGGKLPEERPTDDWLDQRFFELEESEIRTIASRYSCDYLVSRSGYGFPREFCVEDSCVYRLTKTGIGKK